MKLHNEFAIEPMELLGIRIVIGEYNDIKDKAAENDKNSVINITNYNLSEYELNAPGRIVMHWLSINRLYE